MAGSWGLISKTANANLNNTNFPACWEDSGKIYCKGQGENDINVFDIATDTWSLFHTIIVSYLNYPQSTNISGDLLWCINGYVYVFGVGKDDGINPFCRLFKINISTKVATFTNLSWSAFFDVNKHKTIVKIASGRFFIIHWYLRQIWEFLPASDTFINCNVTWPTASNNWITTESNIAGPTACAYGDYIYLCGTRENNYEQSNTYMYYLNTATMSFVQGGVLNLTFGINNSAYYYPYSGALFSLGNNLYWHGGYYIASYNGGSSGQVTVTKLMSYNTATNMWAQVSDLATVPYVNHSSIITTSAAYFIGGTISGSASQAVNAFTYLLDTPTAFQGIYNPVTMAVDLTWTDNSNEETNYIIDRKRNDELTWSELIVLPANTLTYSDTTVDIHSYFYEYRLCCEKAM
jgi:hypothetical protein